MKRITAPHLLLTTLTGAALLASGCHHAAAPAGPAPAPAAAARACPDDLDANACRRYRYFMDATDTVVVGLPTEPDAQRTAAQAMSPTDCSAAATRLDTWAAAHQADRQAIADGGALAVEAQKVLRYGSDEAHPRFEIDQRLDLVTRDLTCPALVAAVRSSGLSSELGWQQGVLGMSDYQSPN